MKVCGSVLVGNGMSWQRRMEVLYDSIIDRFYYPPLHPGANTVVLVMVDVYGVGMSSCMVGIWSPLLLMYVILIFPVLMRNM